MRDEVIETADQFGERRIATVVMSDLSGYTALSERFDPELVEGLMDTIKTRAHAIVSEFGGTLNQFIGDEIVALYGIPIAHGRDACSGVSATMKLHQMVNEVSSLHAEALGVTLTLHSGVSSGLLLVGQRDARDGVYTITGDAINTASRLVNVAAANQIVVSPKTEAAVADDFEMVALDPVTLRGKKNPIIPYRVVGPLSPAQRRSRSRGPSSHFVNRATELATLADIAVQARESLVSVAVTGESGVGKTRLIREFTGRLANGYTIISGYTDEVGMRIPYFAWIQCLRAELGISESAEPEMARDAVLQRCAADASLRESAAPLLHLLSLPTTAETERPSKLSGASLQQWLWDAVLAFLRSACTSGSTLILMLDDWQFADDASKALLNEVLRALSAEHIAIILCATERVPGPHVQMELFDLEITAATAMLGNLFNADSVAPDLVQAVYERTDGNPLFIEETAMAMLEDDAIVVDTVARLIVPADQLALPDNVQAAMLQRIDRLPAEDRDCVRRAAIIGREFDAQVLQKMLPHADVIEAVQRLCGLGIFISMSEVSNRFRFTHAIMQEVAYATLLHRSLKALHAEVGSAIEALYPNSIADRYEELAHHYGRSDNAERAIYYAECAGDKAAGRYALGDARRHYHDAYERLRSLEERTPEHGVHLGRVAIKWASASIFAPTSAQLEALEDALSSARERGDRLAMTNAEYWIGRLEYVFGKFTSAIGRFERVSHAASELGLADIEARSAAVLGRMMLFTAQPKRGEEILSRAITLLRPLPDVQELAYSLSGFACLKALMGEFTVAEEQYGRALRLARTHNNASIESLILQQLGWARALRGDWSGAREICGQCAVLAERTGNSVLAAFANIQAAYTLSFDGDPEEARQRMFSGIEQYTQTGARLAASVMHGWAAETFARAFDFEAAREQASTSLARDADGDRFGQISAQRALLLERAAAGDVKSVRAKFSAIEATSNEFALNSDLARATLTYAEALRELGEADASEAYDRASERFERLGMDWFLERTRHQWREKETF